MKDKTMSKLTTLLAISLLFSGTSILAEDETEKEFFVSDEEVIMYDGWLVPPDHRSDFADSYPIPPGVPFELPSVRPYKEPLLDRILSAPWEWRISEILAAVLAILTGWQTYQRVKKNKEKTQADAVLQSYVAALQALKHSIPTATDQKTAMDMNSKVDAALLESSRRLGVEEAAKGALEENQDASPENKKA